MSIQQLADPAVKTALGFVATPTPTDPTLAYTNNGTTSTLRVGSVANTVPITSVPILSYISPTAGQPNPIPIEVTLDPPPPASPLNNVNVAKFHWFKQDPNPILNQDKYGYINLGDGFMKLGAEWAGFGPASVILEGEVIVVNAIGNQVGGAGFELQNGGDSVTPPQANARFYLDTLGQLNLVHLNPASSLGNQVLFFPTNFEAISLATTAVGIPAIINIPITNMISSSEQNNIKHFQVSGTGVQYVGTATGRFFVTATVSLNTISGGSNEAVISFNLNGNPVQNSANTITIRQNDEDSIIIQSFLTLNTNDTIDVQLYSIDANMTATTYPSPNPQVPAQPALTLVGYRIA